MSTQQPDDPQLLVSPVYLAGRGNPAAISTSLYTHRDWGWTTTGTGQLFVSPLHEVHVAFLPQSRDGGWKITRYHEPLGMPAWSVSFSRHTPAEITDVFTRALAQGLASDHPHPWNPGPHARVDKVNGERWYADFSNRTPLYLVTEAVLAFSSTEPVERPRSGIPERNLPYVTTEPALTSGPDPDRRRSAALARTPHVQPAAPSPFTGTAAPGPAASPAPFRRR